MKKTLRPYQQQACQAIAKAWREPGCIPYASVMTGLGKSLCLAALTNRYVNEGKRVLQLVPRLELVEQNYREAFEYMDKPQALGIVCGQLNKRQNHKQVVVAMASSFVNLRIKSGAFDYLLIDECHRVSFKKEAGTGAVRKGTYHKIIDSLLRLNPAMKIAGMTGTPYRLDQGELHEDSHKTKAFFTHKVFDTSVDPGIKSLIDDGYLSHIETLNTAIKVNLEGVKLSGQDFNKDAAGVKFDAIVDDAVSDMRKQFAMHNISTAIIFASNLANAAHILNAWGDPDTMRIVCGDESICTKAQRRAAVEWIKHGSGNRYIINVDILAEGFDHKALQCCVLLRVTKSPGRLMQMVGRIIRPHDDKEQAYLLDYGTNCDRLGNIDNIIVPSPAKRRGDAPRKLCLVPGCGEINLLSAKKCKKCGAEFISESEDGNYSMRTKEQALALKRESETVRHEIDSIDWVKCYSKKGGEAMIKGIMYETSYDSIPVPFYEYYLCLNHIGAAKDKANHNLLKMFKNPADYYLLGSAHINVDNVLLLLQEHPAFFKRIKEVWLRPGNGKYKQLKEIEYV